MPVKLRTIVLVIAAAAATLWAADDPLAGTWKFNHAKTKTNGPIPKSRAITIAPSGSGFTVRTDTVTQQGKQESYTYLISPDGKEYPDRGGPDRDTIAWKRIDPRHWETTSKKAGKITAQSKRDISPDGKTFTINNTTWNAQGQPVHSVVVYDKQ